MTSIINTIATLTGEEAIRVLATPPSAR